MIDRATIDKIMDAANIVDVVSEFVTLRKAGANYKGLCPFHNEKTPSFVVSPSKGFCHCFSCGKGGNVVGFLMEHEQMTYPEALRWLARKYHIDVQERELSDKEKKEESERESLFIVNEWAMNYFQNILYNHIDGKAIGMQYLRTRGLRDDTIKAFGLGYSLSEKDALAKEAQRKGYKEQFLIDTGLCYRKENGQLQDRYWGRVIFPVHSVTGRIVAFGGRILKSDAKLAKYVNSPESIIYHKSNELYGIYHAKQQITKQDRVYLVEGYMDVISMHQSGIENVVASSGTSLTPGQIRLIHRFTSNITVLYDGDAAGIHASIRGIDMLLEEGMNVKVLLLPDNDDPDSFARKHDATEYRDYMESHQTDFIDFKTHLLLDGVTDPIKRSEAIGSIVKSVSVIPNAILRDTYIHDCAVRVQMPERTLISTMNKYIRARKEEHEKEMDRERNRREYGETQSGDTTDDAPVVTSASPVMPAADQPIDAFAEVERLLIQTVVRHGEEIIFQNVEMKDGSVSDLSLSQYIQSSLQVDDLSLSNPLYARILNEAVEHQNDAGFKAEEYFMHHHDIEISRICTDLAIQHYQLNANQQMDYSDKDVRNAAIHILGDYKLAYVDRKLLELRTSLATVGNDIAKMMDIMKEIKKVEGIRNYLASMVGGNIIK